MYGSPAYEVESSFVKESKCEARRKKFVPTIWARMGTGFHIQTLHDTNYEEVCSMVIRQYLPMDILTKNTSFEEDEESVHSFRKQLILNMRDSSSLVAIDDNSNQLAAALILRIVNKIDFGRVFSREDIVLGKPYKTCVQIKTLLNRKADIFLQYNCDVFMRFYLLCIKNEYQGCNLGLHLLRTGLQVSRYLRIPIACGIFPSNKLQEDACRLGFEVIEKLDYSELTDDKDELIISKPGFANKFCAFMVATVPLPIITQIVSDIPKIAKPDKKEKKKK